MGLAGLDILVRGASMGILFVVVVTIWSSRITRDAQMAFTFVAITSATHMISTIGPTLGVPEGVVTALKLVNGGGALAMTWLALAIFLDDRRFNFVMVGSALLLWIIIPFAKPFPEITPFLRGYAALHFLGLLALVIRSGVGDLQDARRRFRPMMCAFLLVYCLRQALFSKPLQDVRTLDLPAIIGHSGLFLGFLVIFAIWAMKANLDHWPGRTEPRAASEPTPAQQTSQHNALIRRINAAMSDGVWREEGLTVGTLAQKVNAPEHQVRKAINQGLGHRNFASFINGARIEEAKAQFLSDEGAEKTVLEVAFDVGFSSLGPFNRAFRDATGQSPTDFRRTATA